MTIPADVIEKAWQQWFNCDDEPLCDQQPFEQARFNAAAQLIWNAAVEACAKVTCDWCLGSWALNDKGDFHPEANAKCEAWAIRAMFCGEGEK